MARYVDIDKPRYVRYKDERSGEVVTSEQTIAELLDGSIGLIDEEIVRCKGCRHTYHYGNQLICLKLYWCDSNNFEPSAEDFCSLGERRE